jgi:AcrR family transcriptional regulator
MEARKPSTRERLLDVAENLFATNGFAGTSFRDIGSALGIANASITYHFPSKKKIYAAVLSRVADSARTVVVGDADDGYPAAEQIRRMVDRVSDWGETNPGYLRLLVREMMENPERLTPDSTPFMADVVNGLRRPIDRARQEGYLRDVDPLMFLLHLIGAISYFSIAAPTVGLITHQADIGELRGRFRATLHQVVETCLAARPAPSPPDPGAP